ncbi:ERG9, squalene synthase [Lineolata rhizophorae]|uniref:Squalene synthase n=1 Tax=Lineolata rhizophorae TaxID=578093 RepID=A0A6A6NRK4_9PEZI|nr:ERG9, squalene synthase [Lineolata rhizophorae]
MPKASDIAYYLLRPKQVRSIIQWKVWHQPVHERNPDKEEPTLRQCFTYLDLTSRSFSAVIQELHPELLVPVCLFYLVLRGLDTIEDDMTIPLERKEPLLRNFRANMKQDGWTFDGSGPDEKDRELLVHFDCVIAEYKKVKPEYREIIDDITQRMADGMADYANNAEHSVNGVDTVKDYERYCHYVAGLVGEGLTRLFVKSELANPALLERPHLHESMGQFLQQVNIIRDIREDLEDKRRFWPKEVWSKYVTNFEDLLKPENEEKALHCSSEMVLIALSRADQCLFYLAGLKEQSVFNFCAIPQAMAIATLELCFRNPDLFKRNIKISKGDACKLMWESTQNVRLVYDVFRRYVRYIHEKNEPSDPHYMQISIACGRIEQFIETIFPSQQPPEQSSALSREQEDSAQRESREAMWDVFYMFLAVFGVLLVITALMTGVAYLFGARFGAVADALRARRQAALAGVSSAKAEATQVVQEHGEL